MIGIDAQSLFDRDDVICWRRLPDRENCTLDADLPDGRHVRFHIKRYPASHAAAVNKEVEGHRLLEQRRIPTGPLVAWGTLEDGRGVVVFDDLAGYAPADKLIERGTPFDLLLEPTADLAARLHSAGLHHRDLYLCHFMARVIGDKADLKLIDTARVKPLPGLLTRRRWIVKDLGQFWYSTLKHAITDEQRMAWLTRYAGQRQMTGIEALRRRIERKSRSIGRHDARLHQKRPERDVSIPH